MKAYRLSRDQIVGVTGALFIEVLSAEFARQIGPSARSALSAATPLGEGGLELSPEERGACLARAARFFGAEGLFGETAPETLGDAAVMIEARIWDRLTTFCFSAAGGLGRLFDHPADRIFGDAAALGKPVGQDADMDKATFVKLLGAEGARDQARGLVERAKAHLDRFGDKAAPLEGAADFAAAAGCLPQKAGVPWIYWDGR